MGDQLAAQVFAIFELDLLPLRDSLVLTFWPFGSVWSWLNRTSNSDSPSFIYPKTSQNRFIITWKCRKPAMFYFWKMKKRRHTKSDLNFGFQKFFGSTGLILTLMDDKIYSSFFFGKIFKKMRKFEFSNSQIENHTRADLFEAFSSEPYIEKIWFLHSMSVREQTVCKFWQNSTSGQKRVGNVKIVQSPLK